jgi:hypothetical protein
MGAVGRLRRLAAQYGAHMSYMRQTRMHPLYSHNSPVTPASCRRVGRLSRSVQRYPHASSRCRVLRPIMRRNTCSYAPVRRLRNARLSSSAVRAMPMAAYEVLRRTTLSWIRPWGDG